MSLLISIIKSPDTGLAVASAKTFTEQGGTIGRSNENEWVLQDPERFLSSRHCQISFESGQYFITDLSTNGTFLNGAPEPLGKGNRAPLNDGDHFVMGDYEFQVQMAMTGMDDNSPFAAAPAASSSMDIDDIFAAPGSDSPFGAPIENPPGGVDSLFSTEPEETDPLAAFDKAQQIPGAESEHNDPFADPMLGSSSMADQASPVNQAVSWPSAIPEDWDEDGLGLEPSQAPQTPPAQQAPAAPAQPTPPPVPQPSADVSGAENLYIAELEAKLQALEHQNKKLTYEVKALKLKLSDSRNGTPATAVPRGESGSVIEAMGLSTAALSNEEIDAINQTLGALVRETIAGLMQVLGSRSSIKNEFRMSVTTIQPVENNPLKFSANIDDALENMFLKKSNAYKAPLDAAREGFQSIAEHQMAVLAGIRSAFRGLIERFDPETLVHRFEKQGKGINLPGLKNVKNWELYTNYYQELVEDMDNSFQYLFGDDFVRAYEDQLQRLAIERKASKREK